MSITAIDFSGDESTDVIYLGNPNGISAYADQQTNAANAFLLRLGDATAGLAPPVIEPEFPDNPATPPLLTSTAPRMAGVVWHAPDAPPTFTATIDISDLLPATFDDDPPALVIGATPTFNELAPDAPPLDTTFVMPELSLTLPAAPNLLSISVVPFDGVTIPTVDFTVPELEVAAPTIREYTPGEEYTSALLTAMQAELLDRIQNGGTGLAADVENAIWDRGRERETRSAADALAELERMEALGYAFPPGVYVDARLKVQTELDYAARGHSREVMIKQAELEQANIQHALTTATQLEGQLISYSNSVEQRLFDACRFATEAGVSIYNARVQAYSAYVDAYKAKVAIYEAQVRAETIRVEAYRAAIDAERAKAEINRALIDQYKVQADLALANVEIFKAEIGAIQAKAEIEKSKILIYGEQVKAYAARVGAYTAGVEGFRASIQAEASKQDAYKSRVEAYSAQVNAGSKMVEARVAAYRGEIEASTARWEGYKAASAAEASRIQAVVGINQTRGEIYRNEVAAVTSYNETLTKQWQVSLEQAQRTAEIGVSTAKANAELYMTTRSLAIDAAKVGAQVAAQLGSAALNAINWSTSYSNSRGTSSSWSRSVGQSESHNYSYSVSV